MHFAHGHHETRDWVILVPSRNAYYDNCVKRDDTKGRVHSQANWIIMSSPNDHHLGNDSIVFTNIDSVGRVVVFPEWPFLEAAPEPYPFPTPAGKMPGGVIRLGVGKCCPPFHLNPKCKFGSTYKLGDMPSVDWDKLPAPHNANGWRLGQVGPAVGADG
jgi:hypothetical protein